MDEIAVAQRPVQRFAEVLDANQLSQFTALMDTARRSLAGHTVWHVNSAAEGGGVAEMLQSILGYPAECEIPIRWLVIDGSEPFFEVTKRLHHLLHGRSGDGGQLGVAERRLYESTLARGSERLAQLVEPGDPVVLHDPQTLGLAPVLARAGAHVVWSCHIGADQANDNARAAWQFLYRYVGFTEYQIFSRPQYVWEGLDPSRVAIIPPCIDAFSAKNQPLDDGTVTSILDAAGLLPARSAAVAGFTRIDETTGRVATRAGMIEDAPLPTTAQVIAQVSRWDPLKDHVGVMTGFCDYVPPDDGIHLVLAGPDPESVADDPEGQQTLAELRAARDGLHPECRRRVHIACLPMDDVDENAAIVNALQRRADVIVQKSLAEGFGLTVAEAMWKGRPTVASRVGGIQDQIEPEVSGVLIEPSDLAGLGAAVTTLLEDEETATALGQAARARVCEEYLAPRHLERQFRLLLDVVSRG